MSGKISLCCAREVAAMSEDEVANWIDQMYRASQRRLEREGEWCNASVSHTHSPANNLGKCDWCGQKVPPAGSEPVTEDEVQFAIEARIRRETGRAWAGSPAMSEEDICGYCGDYKENCGHAE